MNIPYYIEKLASLEELCKNSANQDFLNIICGNKKYIILYFKRLYGGKDDISKKKFVSGDVMNSVLNSPQFNSLIRKDAINILSFLLNDMIDGNMFFPFSYFRDVESRPEVHNIDESSAFNEIVKAYVSKCDSSIEMMRLNSKIRKIVFGDIKFVPRYCDYIKKYTHLIFDEMNRRISDGKDFRIFSNGIRDIIRFENRNFDKILKSNKGNGYFEKTAEFISEYSFFNYNSGEAEVFKLSNDIIQELVKTYDMDVISALIMDKLSTMLNPGFRFIRNCPVNKKVPSDDFVYLDSIDFKSIVTNIFNFVSSREEYMNGVDDDNMVYCLHNLMFRFCM